MTASFGISSLVSTAMFGYNVRITRFETNSGAVSTEPFTAPLPSGGTNNISIDFRLVNPMEGVDPKDVLGTPRFEFAVSGAPQEALKIHRNGWVTPDRYSMYIYLQEGTGEAVLKSVYSEDGTLRWSSEL